jgi:hypothetical protein
MGILFGDTLRSGKEPMDFSGYAFAALATAVGLAAAASGAILTLTSSHLQAAQIALWIAAICFAGIGVVWGVNTTQYGMIVRMVAAGATPAFSFVSLIYIFSLILPVAAPNNPHWGEQAVIQPDNAQPDRALPDNAQHGIARYDNAQPDRAQPDNAQHDTAQSALEQFQNPTGTLSLVYFENRPDGTPNFISMKVTNRKLSVDPLAGKITFVSIYASSSETKSVEAIFALSDKKHNLTAVWDDTKKTMSLVVDGREINK